ncbi:integrase core domain [Elysia marginata]|uniref:Integrase core domain n=1 Tax=Elysia marginata TaxID=1093978 RepID=A0AAV4EA63_9GAST|nr:integrase core domain [Elysia marginata]
MDLIHKSHMGMVKCKQRGREVFFWPSMNAEIEQKVKNCQAINREKFCKQYYKTKEKQKFYYDRKARNLEPLGNHTPVRLQPTAGSKVWTPARITGKLGPRSYAVTSDDGTFRGNRRHIIRSTEQANKQHVMSIDAVDDEADNFDAKINNSGLPDTSPPPVEVPPSPTIREFSSSLPLTDNVSLRAHSDNASTHQYVTRSGRRVRKPDKYTL